MAGGGGVSNQISSWAGGGGQTTLGAVQLAYGMYLDKKNKRPSYEIPPEIAQNLSMAQQQALQGLPEEQKQEYISNLQRSQAYSLNALGDRKSGIAGIASLNENQNRGYANLLAQDSAARMQNQRQVFAQNQNVADYKDQAFQINKLNPYYEIHAKAQALQGSGMQNIGSGLNQGGGSGDFSKGMQQQPQQQQYRSQPVQTTYMSPYQMEGYNQQTTPNPYANEQTFNAPAGYNSGFNYGG